MASEIEKALGPATPMRVANQLFFRWCYSRSEADNEALEFYEGIEMDEREKEVESAVRADGRDPMRDMQGNLCFVLRPSA